MKKTKELQKTTDVHQERQKNCRIYKERKKTGEGANNRFTRRENERTSIKGYEPGNY
jgi:hypothetical protein